jgi:hypothetical protein
MSKPPSPPRLLDLVRQVALTRFGQDGPAERYADWTRRLILFHDKRPPRELAPGDLGRFLKHVADTAHDALSGREEAHTVLTFHDHSPLGLSRRVDILGNAC